MNMAPIVTTEGFEKPAMASSGVRIPVSIRAIMTPIAVRSSGSFSVMKRNMVTNRMIDRSTIAMVKLSSVKLARYWEEFPI
jgi:hypothetical protein